MTKVRNPFFSFDARGGLGNGLTLTKRRGVNIAEKKPIPRQPNTSGQLAVRGVWQDGIVQWHALSAAEKQEWESLARPKHMTGFAFFMSGYMNENYPPEPPPPPEPELKASLTEPDNDFWTIGGIRSPAQTFIAIQDFTIGKVELKLGRRVSVPEWVTVSLRNTTGHLPSGDDLSAVSFPASDLPLTTTPPFFPVTLPGYALLEGIEYALVVLIGLGSSSGDLVIRFANINAYPDGQRCYSMNRGDTWTARPTDDHLFKVWSTGE